MPLLLHDPKNTFRCTARKCSYANKILCIFARFPCGMPCLFCFYCLRCVVALRCLFVCFCFCLFVVLFVRSFVRSFVCLAIMIFFPKKKTKTLHDKIFEMDSIQFYPLRTSIYADSNLFYTHAFPFNTNVFLNYPHTILILHIHMILRDILWSYNIVFINLQFEYMAFLTTKNHFL